MQTLTQRVVTLVLSLFAVGVVCIVIGCLLEMSGQAAFEGGGRSALAGSAVTLPAAIFTLLFLSRHGSGVRSVLLVTLLRFSLTLGLTLYVAWSFPTLRSLPFFLTVTVVYLVGLFVETWLAWKDYQQVGEDLPCLRHKP